MFLYGMKERILFLNRQNKTILEISYLGFKIPIGQKKLNRNL